MYSLRKLRYHRRRRHVKPRLRWFHRFCRAHCRKRLCRIHNNTGRSVYGWAHLVNYSLKKSAGHIYISPLKWWVIRMTFGHFDNLTIYILHNLKEIFKSFCKNIFDLLSKSKKINRNSAFFCWKFNKNRSIFSFVIFTIKKRKKRQKKPKIATFRV